MFESGWLGYEIRFEKDQTAKGDSIVKLITFIIYSQLVCIPTAMLYVSEKHYSLTYDD